jgi:Flp pilus assembly protein TadG
MSARRFFSHQDGAAAVEMGILLLPLMLILFGILDYGIAFNRQLTAARDVREAVRTAVVSQTTDGLSPLLTQNCSEGETAIAVFQQTYQPQFFSLLPSLNLYAEAEMRCETISS